MMTTGCTVPLMVPAAFSSLRTWLTSSMSAPWPRLSFLICLDPLLPMSTMTGSRVVLLGVGTVPVISGVVAITVSFLELGFSGSAPPPSDDALQADGPGAVADRLEHVGAHVHQPAVPLRPARVPEAAAVARGGLLPRVQELLQHVLHDAEP